MKYFDWNLEKNEQLLKERGINFEEILIAIESGYLLDVIEHTNKDKYPEQKILIVQIHDYVYIVPYKESEDKIFLKTIIPSRKATKKYINKK